MEILKSAVILVIGFVLLIKGADYFVEGSSSVAKKFKVPSLIIGMTIVAMGTSLPELAVSVTAAMAGNNTLAVSNVAGSNIFNLMVVCGACALFAPLAIEKNTLMKEFPFSILLCRSACSYGISWNVVRPRGWRDPACDFCRIPVLDDTVCEKSKDIR